MPRGMGRKSQAVNIRAPACKPRPPHIPILGENLLANIVSCLTYPKLHLEPHLKDYNFSFLYTAAISELSALTTAIHCTKYCALSGLNSFFVMCFARNKYSNTVNWSTIFKTYIRRTPTVGGFPCCFQSFSATKLPPYTCMWQTPLYKSH